MPSIQDGRPEGALDDRIQHLSGQTYEGPSGWVYLSLEFGFMNIEEARHSVVHLWAGPGNARRMGWITGEMARKLLPQSTVTEEEK